MPENITISSMSDLMHESKKIQDELLGVESEDEVDDSSIGLPYNVEDIRISQKMMSIFQVCRWIELKVLDLRPDFQRNLVWDLKRKSLLIESLLLCIPIPAFYMDEDEDGNKTVIDGLQRLSTIYSYMNNEFPLSGLQYLATCEGKYYSEIERKYHMRIEDTQLAVNILDVRCPEMVKFDVFRRVNTGGLPLNAQEVRNIQATTETRELLIEMSVANEFRQATRGRIKDIRMDAQELCLRFIAFYLRYNPADKELHHVDSMAQMLDETILRINKMSIHERSHIFEIFKNSMKKCYNLLGDSAFSKESSRYIINKPLFTSWSVILSNYDLEEGWLCGKHKLAIHKLYDILRYSEYFNAITSSTSSKRNISTQFLMVEKIMEDLTHD